MKILKNNLNAPMEVSPYPKELICDKCGSELEYDESDLYIGEYGWSYVDCPVCGRSNLLDEDEHHITLTMDNIEFPTHFHHVCVETGAVDCCKQEYIRRYIEDAIRYFRKNKEEYCWGTHMTGNLYLTVLRLEGDGIYEIYVSKDFYESEIPFSTEDYA